VIRVLVLAVMCPLIEIVRALFHLADTLLAFRVRPAMRAQYLKMSNWEMDLFLQPLPTDFLMRTVHLQRLTIPG
jgi:hypothetical protein